IIGVTSAGIAQLRLHAKVCLSYARSRTLKHVRVEGFRRITQFPLDWHARENVGNRMQRIQNGAGALTAVLKMLSAEFFRTFVPLVAATIIFITIDWRLFLFALGYIVIAGAN